MKGGICETGGTPAPGPIAEAGFYASVPNSWGKPLKQLPASVLADAYTKQGEIRMLLMDDRLGCLKLTNTQDVVACLLKLIV